jgi:hypothetical protein
MALAHSKADEYMKAYDSTDVILHKTVEDDCVTLDTDTSDEPYATFEVIKTNRGNWIMNAQYWHYGDQVIYLSAEESVVIE